MRSFWSFRDQGMWTKHFSSMMMHAHIHVLHDVFDSCTLLNWFPEHFRYGWSWSPCSPHKNPCHWFLWGYLKDHVHHTNPHSVEELQVEIQSVAEGIIGGMLRDTADSFVVCLQWVHEVKGSHTEHFTWRPHAHKLFMNDMFLYPRKLQIYHTSELLCSSEYTVLHFQCI